jgi:hypothetical protein
VSESALGCPVCGAADRDLRRHAIPSGGPLRALLRVPLLAGEVNCIEQGEDLGPLNPHGERRAVSGGLPQIPQHLALIFLA